MKTYVYIVLIIRIDVNNTYLMRLSSRIVDTMGVAEALCGCWGVTLGFKGMMSSLIYKEPARI